MFDKPAESTVSSAQARGIMAMLLALNLFLLSFFILMNSLAGKATEKAELAKQGVKAGFDLKRQDPAYGPDMQRGAEIPWQQNVRTGVKGMVRNLMPLESLQISVDANRMVVDIPPEALFQDGARMSATQQGLVENMLALLSDPQGGKGLKLLLVVYGSVGQEALLAARGASLGEIVAAKSVASPALGKLVAVGVGIVDVGSKPRISLEFRPIGTEPAVPAKQLQQLLVPTGAVVKGERVGP